MNSYDQLNLLILRQYARERSFVMAMLVDTFAMFGFVIDAFRGR